MTCAIGYVRRSTERQEESLDQQRAQLEAFAKAKGWTLAQVFEDDAISGSEMQRPGLDQLIAAAKAGEVDVILTWDRNRLARPKDALDGMLLERRLRESGKRVVYAATGNEADRSFGSDLLSFVEHHQNGDYVREREVVLFQGPPGVGKTHLAIALGVKAVAAGFSVGFARLENLLHVLKRDADVPPRRLKAKKYMNTSLLIIDEIERPLHAVSAARTRSSRYRLQRASCRRFGCRNSSQSQPWLLKVCSRSRSRVGKSMFS